MSFPLSDAAAAIVAAAAERPRRRSVRPQTRNLRYETTPAGDQSKCNRQPGRTARRHRRSRPVRQSTPSWAPDVPKPITHMSQSPLQRSRRPLLPRRTSLVATGTNAHPRPAIDYRPPRRPIGNLFLLLSLLSPLTHALE